MCISETCLVFCSCRVSRDSQAAMERFFQMHTLLIDVIQSLWKAVQILLLISTVWALCHLLHLRKHPCSKLSEECFCLSREYWSHLALTLKNTKYKWNGVARLPKIYYMAGCKCRWQAQEIGLLCSSFSLLQSSLTSSWKLTLTFNNWKWSVFKISEPILSLIYYLPRNRFSDVLTDIILPIKCRGCGYLTLFLTLDKGSLFWISETIH